MTSTRMSIVPGRELLVVATDPHVRLDRRPDPVARPVTAVYDGEPTAPHLGRVVALSRDAASPLAADRPPAKYEPDHEQDQDHDHDVAHAEQAGPAPAGGRLL